MHTLFFFFTQSSHAMGFPQKAQVFVFVLYPQDRYYMPVLHACDGAGTLRVMQESRVPVALREPLWVQKVPAPGRVPGSVPMCVSPHPHSQPLLK